MFFLWECECDCEEGLASGGGIGDFGGGGGGGGVVVGLWSSLSSVGERTWDSETMTAFLRSYFGG